MLSAGEVYNGRVLSGTATFRREPSKRNKESLPCSPFDRKLRNWFSNSTAARFTPSCLSLRLAVVQRGDYEAKIDITTEGHVVTWRDLRPTLTEVATSAHHPLPERRRLFSYKLKGRRNDGLECRGGIDYQVGFHSRLRARAGDSSGAFKRS